jgi:hypothetical protein
MECEKILKCINEVKAACQPPAACTGKELPIDAVPDAVSGLQSQLIRRDSVGEFHYYGADGVRPDRY